MTRHIRSLTVLLVGLLVLGGVIFAAADPPKAKAPAKSSTPTASPAKSDPSLPRVLIIGDSISIGYTEPTRKLLDGKANVFRIPGNGQHTGTGLLRIDDWLGKEKWAAIHFNWGLWDLCHRTADGKKYDAATLPPAVSLENYEKNLRELVKRLKATGAQLVWAATTPVPDGSKGRLKGEELKYNAVAEKIMKENDIAIDDLYAAILPRVAELQQKADVHFTPEGYEFLAQRVAAAFLQALEGKGK